MNSKQYDIIIIGSGMAGVYSALNIKRDNSDSKFFNIRKI